MQENEFEGNEFLSKVKWVSQCWARETIKWMERKRVWARINMTSKGNGWTCRRKWARCYEFKCIFIMFVLLYIVISLSNELAFTFLYLFRLSFTLYHSFIFVVVCIDVVCLKLVSFFSLNDKFANCLWMK